MITYEPKESISISMPLTVDGVALSLSVYAAGADLDGTLGNPPIKVQATIHPEGSGTAASSADLIPVSLDSVTMKRSTDTTVTNVATLSVRKGINPSVTTTYVVTAWYDSTGSGSGGLRICAQEKFKIRVPTTFDSTPPYNAN